MAVSPLLLPLLLAAIGMRLVVLVGHLTSAQHLRMVRVLLWQLNLLQLQHALLDYLTNGIEAEQKFFLAEASLSDLRARPQAFQDRDFEPLLHFLGALHEGPARGPAQSAE
jgi:hypothetical protein